MATARPLELLSERYRLGALLGQGGMAEVFLAEDLRLGREVAVKMLRPQLGADQSVRLRFEQEARTAARLSHPNVVGIIDTGEDDGIAFIIMERLDGTTLADELGAGPLTEQRTRHVAAQVLDALQAAHEAGIVHRDIKPANVLTCPDGRVKVADFGIATAMDEAQAITSTGLLIGTPAYLAPERLAGAPASASADLYSLASVLYQCLTGRRPFENTSTIELISAIRDRSPEPISVYRPDVSPPLAGLIERTLAKDPALRPLSAKAMRRLLDGAGNTETVEMPPLGGDATRVMLAPIPSVTPPAALGGADATRARSPRSSGVWRPQSRRREPTEKLKAVREWAARYKIALAFLGAVLLALVIALPLAASGTSVPTSRPPRATHATAPTGAKGLPGPVAHALAKLERAVR